MGIAIEPSSIPKQRSNMGKILSFTKKKKSVKKSMSYLEYLHSIIEAHKENKILSFPTSKVINRRYGKKF